MVLKECIDYLTQNHLQYEYTKIQIQTRFSGTRSTKSDL